MHPALSLFAIVLFAPGAPAAEKAGVTLPDAVEVDGQKLVLNGIGVREATALKIDVYAAGLYLPEKTSDAADIIGTDQPWQVRMKFVRDVDEDDLADAWKEGLGKKDPALTSKLVSYMTDIEDGQSMVFTYVPGKGTTVSVKGGSRGTIAGVEFAKRLLGVWLGPEPPNTGLKKGMLGK